MKDKLAIAIFEENIVLVAELIKEYDNLDAVMEVGRTPLMQAAECENLEIVKLLLDAGANINAKGLEGYTALQVAVDISIDGTIQCGGKQGDEPTNVIEFLLKNGADLTTKNDCGETALDIAKAYKSHKIISLLEAWQP